MLRLSTFVVAALAVLALESSVAWGRVWTDSTGKYTVDAELIAQSETTAVLKKDDHSLVAVPLDRLSAADRQYLQSKDVADTMQQSANQRQTWTLVDGMTLQGKLVSYGHKDVELQRRRGKIYVNDRLFDNLTPLQQAIVFRIVAHFENTKIDDRRDLEEWILKLKGQPKTFPCDGVMMELENGDEYGVPLFFFSAADLQLLQPGWDRWAAAAKDAAERERQSFLAASQAQARQRDKQVSQQVQMMQLELLAYDSGLFDLWEVHVAPRPGVAGQPMVVVVPGRSSAEATATAMQKYPGYVAGAVAKVRRR